MKLAGTLGLGFLAAMLSVGGCVRPGHWASTTAGRYHRYLARSGAPERNLAGIGLFRPASGPADVPVEFIEAGSDEPPRLALTLPQAVRLALANSPDVHVVSYDPAVSRQDVIRAAAAFDATLFGSTSYGKEDVRTTSIFGGGQTYQKGYTVGARQRVVTGGQWSLAWTTTRTWDNSQFSALGAYWEPILSLEIRQPLLRDAWPEVNLARLRLARLDYRMSLSAFRETVERIIADVITRYWTLAQARREYEIQQGLLEETIETRRKISERRRGGLTAGLSVDQIDTAVASRRAALRSVRQRVGDAQDGLVRLLADERINLRSDCVLVPVTEMEEEPVVLEEKDQLLTALRHSPRLEQARLLIRAREIDVTVAENATLPTLDLVGSTQMQGLDRYHHQAIEDWATGDFVGYRIGLEFEYPLGNRAARAGRTRAMLARGRALASLQQAADELALEIARQLRRVRTAHDRIGIYTEALRAARAYRDKLAVTVSRELGRDMTPDRLQLLLGAQQSVADSERARVQAVAEYNQALTALDRVKGVVLERYRVYLPMDAEPGAP